MRNAVLLAAIILSIGFVSVSPAATSTSAEPTPMPSPTDTPSPTPESTPESTPTPDPTPDPTPSPTPENTPAPTTTPEPSLTPTATPTATPTPVGGLRVQGNALVTSGQRVRLHGVNRSGTEFACSQGYGIFNGPNDAASLEAIRSWRVNAIRVPLNEDCWLAINGVPPEFSGAVYRQAIYDYVNLLNQNGLYAILDLHWSGPGTDLAQGQEAMADLDHAPAFWSSVASMFGSNEAVIFELFNEPWPDNNLDTDAAWTCWRDGGTCPGVSFEAAGMQTLVDSVRATGATNVIALTGVQWGNSVSQWLAYKPSDPLNQLVASWHVYDNGWCVTVSCYESNAAPTAAQVPLLVTEFGANDCNAAFLNALMEWLDGHDASYVAWVWNAWGVECNHRALVLDYAGGPTSYGEIYRAHLAGLP